MIQSALIYGQQYINQSGRALDANLRLGSMGINSPYRWESINRNNQLMTGNIGGGRSFKGIIPYGSQQELSNGVSFGLNTLNNFRRDSVSASNLNNSGINNPMPYYNNTTVSRYNNGLNYNIRDQYRANASYDNTNKYQNKVNRVLSVDNYRPLSINNRKSNSNLQLLPFKMNEVDTNEPINQNPNLPFNHNLTSRAALLMQDNTEIDNNQDIIHDDILDSKMPESFYLEQSPKTSQEETTTSDQTTNVFYKKNINKSNTLTSKNINEETTPQTNEPDDSNATSVSKMPTITFGNESNSTTPKIIMKNENAFNKAMAQGETNMRAGQYYKAADSYDLAGKFAKHHPLHALAKSHALFGAGEYMSSAYFLNQAFTLSPTLSLRTFELPAILSQEGVIADRLAELDKYIDRTEHPMLYFLRGYIAIQQNNMPLANESLQKALLIQPNTKSVELLLESMPNEQ